MKKQHNMVLICFTKKMYPVKLLCITATKEEGQMGLFGKKKPSQEDANRAANVFAERDKQPAESTMGNGVEDRIFGYTSHKGADAVKAEATAHLPTDRISELRRIRDERSDETKAAQAAAAQQVDQDGKSAADVYMTARKNILDSTGIQRSEGPSAEERAQTTQHGMNTLGDIVSGIKNEQFFNTKVEADIGGSVEKKPAAENMDTNEVAAATAKFRNVGFFTETEVDESKPTLTKEEQLERDLDELDHAEKAIASFTNVGFKNPSQPVSEEINEVTEEEGEGM